MDSKDRVDVLEAQIIELRAQVARLTDVPPANVANDDPGRASPSSRRNLLKLAGAAAVGAAVAVGTGSTPAAANDPNDLTLGAIKVAGGATRADYPVDTDPNSSPFSAFFFQVGTSLVNQFALPFGGALVGRTATGNSPSGVVGLTNQVAGFGVIGSNTAATGTGVRGNGVLVGVAGDATDVLGLGVTGSGATGVRGNGTAIGVEGISTAGFGVRGAGSTGVLAVGVGTGVNGTVTTADGVGVSGSGGDNGIGVRGIGGVYALSATRSSKANLFLQPNNDLGGVASPKTVPTARTDAHLAGELEDVAGDLWLCVVSGTPGTWRKLGGVATAGAFHAVTPGRVYDSRAATPSPGAISAPGTRLLSVADRRDLVSGASVLANFVPARATAISCNVTVVNTVQSGFLTINPGGTTTVSAATINWSAGGQILNNGVMLTLNANREVTVIAGGIPGAAADFVIDVNGYFL